MKLPALTVVLAAGCVDLPRTIPVASGSATSQTDTRVAFGQEFKLGNGEAALVGNDELIVRFERVTADERCPVGDPCTGGEGDAVLLLTVQQPSKSPHSLELHTDPARTTEGQYLEYRVKVIRLEPRPIGEQPVPLPRYVATLRVSK